MIPSCPISQAQDADAQAAIEHRTGCDRMGATRCRATSAANARERQERGAVMRLVRKWSWIANRWRTQQVRGPMQETRKKVGHG